MGHSSKRVISAEEMAQWFLENYSDPVHSLPYCSADGGYQYFAGGPYDAEDVLRGQFEHDENLGDEDSEGDFDENVAKAIDIVSEEGGPDWIKISDYS